jgi:hypothetical protein
MYSMLRVLLILHLLRGDGWAWLFRIILALSVFWLLIYSVVR